MITSEAADVGLLITPEQAECLLAILSTFLCGQATTELCVP